MFVTMNFNTLIEKIYNEVKKEADKGKVASYIPELLSVNHDSFGVYITSIDKKGFGVGNCNDKFSIQSIAKVITLSLAYSIVGEAIWKRLDVEPSGTSYNSLIQLEADKGVPRNPFINAGALVIVDILISNLKAPKEEFLSYIRELSNNKTIDYSSTIAASEKAAGYRNVALCNFIKSFNNIENDPSDVLDLYFDICSIEVTCKELSELFLFLANNGENLFNAKEVINISQSKRINAIMQTCGFYDESGEFAFRVGLPGKSGVGGGIVAVHPSQYVIAVWSPRLNEKGNSYKGMQFLERFTTESQLSIF